MVAHIFVSGFVQNVGYRQFIKRIAYEIGLTGWVRNLPDGRVEALFQGPKDKIEEAIEESNKGPFLSEVKDVVVEWEEEREKLGNFVIE